MPERWEVTTSLRYYAFWGRFGTAPVITLPPPSPASQNTLGTEKYPGPMGLVFGHHGLIADRRFMNNELVAFGRNLS